MVVSCSKNHQTSLGEDNDENDNDPNHPQDEDNNNNNSTAAHDEMPALLDNEDSSAGGYSSGVIGDDTSDASTVSSNASVISESSDSVSQKSDQDSLSPPLEEVKIAKEVINETTDSVAQTRDQQESSPPPSPPLPDDTNGDIIAGDIIALNAVNIIDEEDGVEVVVDIDLSHHDSFVSESSESVSQKSDQESQTTQEENIINGDIAIALDAVHIIDREDSDQDADEDADDDISCNDSFVSESSESVSQKSDQESQPRELENIMNGDIAIALDAVNIDKEDSDEFVDDNISFTGSLISEITINDNFAQKIDQESQPPSTEEDNIMNGDIGLDAVKEDSDEESSHDSFVQFRKRRSSILTTPIDLDIKVPLPIDGMNANASDFVEMTSPVETVQEKESPARANSGGGFERRAPPARTKSGEGFAEPGRRRPPPRTKSGEGLGLGLGLGLGAGATDFAVTTSPGETIQKTGHEKEEFSGATMRKTVHQKDAALDRNKLRRAASSDMLGAMQRATRQEVPSRPRPGGHARRAPARSKSGDGFGIEIGGEGEQAAPRRRPPPRTKSGEGFQLGGEGGGFERRPPPRTKSGEGFDLPPVSATGRPARRTHVAKTKSGDESGSPPLQLGSAPLSGRRKSIQEGVDFQVPLRTDDDDNDMAGLIISAGGKSAQEGGDFKVPLRTNDNNGMAGFMMSPGGRTNKQKDAALDRNKLRRAASSDMLGAMQRATRQEAPSNPRPGGHARRAPARSKSGDGFGIEIGGEGGGEQQQTPSRRRPPPRTKSGEGFGIGGEVGGGEQQQQAPSRRRPPPRTKSGEGFGIGGEGGGGGEKDPPRRRPPPRTKSGEGFGLGGEGGGEQDPPRRRPPPRTKSGEGFAPV
jgi:hypothetical protein